MKRGIFAIACMVLAAALAEGNSIGFGLEEADLVLTGAPRKIAGGSASFDLFRIDDAEAIRGDLPEGPIAVVVPRLLDYRPSLAEGARTLFFLRREEGDLGLSFNGSLYMVLASPVGAVNVEDEEGAALLEAARLQAAVLDAPRAQKAETLSRLASRALASGRERLMESVLTDAVRTPGGLGRLDALDRTRLLERFREAAPFSTVKLRLLDALAEARPAGFEAALVDMVRGPEGEYHRDQIAAILAGEGGAGAAADLVAGFETIESEAVRANILYVLGHMGGGRGVEAIRSVMNLRLEGVQNEAIAALYADGSRAAVEALGEIASGPWSEEDVLDAVDRIAAIGSRTARAVLLELEKDRHLRESVRKKAAEFQSRLSR